MDPDADSITPANDNTTNPNWSTQPEDLGPSAGKVLQSTPSSATTISAPSEFDNRSIDLYPH